MTVYRYFVSYSHEGTRDHPSGRSFGNLEATSPSPITSYEEIQALQKSIAARAPFPRQVIVINFILLGS